MEGMVDVTERAMTHIYKFDDNTRHRLRIGK